MTRTLILAAAAALLAADPAGACMEPPAAVHRSATDLDLQWGPCPAFLPAGCGIAVLHGDPAGPQSDVYFKVPAGSTVPAHWHTSAERMVLVSGKLHVTYAGQDTVTMTPGSYAYGPAQHPHHAVCDAGDPCILFIAFDEPVDAFAVEAAD
jgi:quercetin dioxygenase-like cupin family protein